MATDRSNTAAIIYAVDLAKHLNASVLAMSVIDNRRFTVLDIMPITEPDDTYLYEAAKEYLVEIEKLCDKSGVQRGIVVTKGHPVEDIVKDAKKSIVDLTVMGSHGRSALTASVLGSVAYGVIHNLTEVPVLIVR